MAAHWSYSVELFRLKLISRDVDALPMHVDLPAEGTMCRSRRSCASMPALTGNRGLIQVTCSILRFPVGGLGSVGIGEVEKRPNFRYRRAS